jgi:hypothetical protein
MYIHRDIETAGATADTGPIMWSRNIIWMCRMFYKKEIGQDIAVLPMLIPGIDDPAPNPIWEGTTTVPGPTSLLTREGEANGVANTVEPEATNAASEPTVKVATRTSSGRMSKPPDCLIKEIGAIVVRELQPQ